MSEQFSTFFPPHESADEDGLLAIGGDLSRERLECAYRSGIFPWPMHEQLLAWFSPPQRALLFLDEFRMPRSLSRVRRSTQWRYTIDQAFDEVIEACATATNRFDTRGRPQAGTWITPEMQHAYKGLARAHRAHSIECWSESNELIGGLYGVSIGMMFAGESMFYRIPNASKCALCFLVEYLREKGVSWVDCQVMTPLFESFGARLVSRAEFLKLLDAALCVPSDLFPPPQVPRES